ncbi:MAG: hypothetical protein ACI9IA_000218 [Enterobacterales bacterium]|jgi:hypothetical protein
MASTDIVAPARQTFYVGDVAYRRALSESLLLKVASASNYIVDRVFYTKDFTYNGYFDAGGSSEGVGGVMHVLRDCTIDSYVMSFYFTGTSGTTSMNFNVYDSDGVFVSLLFTTGVTCNATSDNYVSVGYNVGESEAIEVLSGTSAVVDNNYNAFITLLKGYTIIPVLANSGTNAKHMNFNFRFKEL